LYREEADEPGVTVVERAWVQTWLTNEARQDRVVFALTSDRPHLQLALPSATATAATQILLDGEPVSAPADDDGRVSIPLAAEGNHRRHVLEVRSDYPQQRRRPGRLMLEVPRLAGDVTVRRTYWQLVLPIGEHLVAGPRGFTAESRWGWTDYFWGRRPLLEQMHLENWVGATNRTPVPGKTNRYLFGSLGQIEPVSLRTASRAWIVLGASGVALVIGLLLIYVPACRHPGGLFLLAIVLLCLGRLYPELMLLAAQAAMLGLALTLLAALLERSVVRRRRGTVIAESPSATLEKGSTQSQLHPPAAGNQISTQAAPAAGPSSSDSNA
jgi:hypothetical protein